MPPRHRPRLPPLRALLAFEATVRLGSATAAAAALGVTHGAISKQLRLLEEAFGCTLFLRSRPQLVPTDKAAAFAAVVAGALDGIAHGAAALSTKSPAAAAREVRIIAPAAFAMRWLIPRLNRLQAGPPHLTAVVRTTDQDEDWRSLVFDVGIRRGEATAPGLARVEVMREMNTLLLGRPAPGALAAELPRWTFCEARTRPGELDRWLARAGVDPAECLDRRPFPRFYLAVEAALAGVGALVGPVQVLADELKAGKLSAPFPAVQLLGDTLACLFDEQGERAPEARAFVAWLTGLAAAATATPPLPAADRAGDAGRVTA